MLRYAYIACRFYILIDAGVEVMEEILHSNANSIVLNEIMKDMSSVSPH